MALFGSDSGIGARRIDEGNHGQIELFPEPHNPKGLAVALRISTTKIALHVFLGVASLLLRDDDTAMRTKPGQAARHRLIVAKDSIAMQLHPLGETAPDVIERKWALHMPGDLDALPRGQVVVNLPSGFANF